MARFDVFENPNEDILNTLATRVVVPLVAASAIGKAIKHLNPEFTIGNAAVFMSTAELAGVPVRSVGNKVGSLKERRHEIIAALDFLFTGF
jgi:toxin CcdB